MRNFTTKEQPFYCGDEVIGSVKSNGITFTPTPGGKYSKVVAKDMDDLISQLVKQTRQLKGEKP